MLRPDPRPWLAIVLLCASSSSSAQSNLDSMNKVWYDTSQSDSIRFLALQDIIRERRYAAPPDSLLGLSRQLLRFAQEHRGPLQQGTALNLCGIFHNDLNQWDSAETAYLSSLRLFEQLADTPRMSSALNNMGNVASYRGDQSMAIEYLTRSLRLSEASGDSASAARALGNIGVTHADLKEYDIALDYFHKRIALADAIGDRQCALEAWICIGMTKELQHRTEEARLGFEKSLKLAREINDPTSIAAVMTNLGHLDVLAGAHERGRTYLDSALLIYERRADVMGMASALTELARSHHLQGDQGRASTYAKRAFEKARESGTEEVLRDAAEIAYLVNKALGRDGDALAMHELFIATRDSMLAEEDVRNVIRQRFQYDYDKRESALNAEQEKERALAATEMERQKIRQRNVIAGAGLLSCLAATLFLLYRNSRRSGRLLAEKNATILDAQAKLVESEREREASEVRTRIARDVHDQLGSDLTKLVMLSTEAREVAKTDVRELPAIANDIERIAGEANRSLGDIVWAIDPHHDSLAGLTERVRAHSERMLEWSKVEHTIDCVHEGPDRPLDPATKRDIYLMLREALNNAIKYAKAERISVRFRTSATQVEFEVGDDGVGMPIGETKGHGLPNMRGRAQRVNGQLQVESRPGEGTWVRFQAPLPT